MRPTPPAQAAMPALCAQSAAWVQVCPTPQAAHYSLPVTAPRVLFAHVITQELTV